MRARLLLGLRPVTLALVLAPAGALAQTEDVVWTSLVGVNAAGNTLTKTAATGWGNAGAISRQTLESNGFVEFTATETNTDRLCGLSQGNPGQSYDVDFSVSLSGGIVYVWEDGAYRGSFGTYASGDRFRVEVAAGVVRYFKNGVSLYTSTVYPRFPLLVDTALYTAGATLTDVRIGTTSFTGAVGVSVSHGTLTKTGSTAGWNAGASSGRRIRRGDGFVEFTATETSTRRACGLSSGDSGQDVSDIDFAIVLNADATVEVQETGVSRGGFGAYAAGDRLRVELEAGTVRYSRNGTLLYTSAVAPAYPLNADTAFDTVGGTLTDVVVSDLVWTDGTAVAISGSSLRKTGGSPGWNAGAISTAVLESGDGYVEFTATETDTSRMCGLGYADSGYGDADIDFAVQLTSAGEVNVLESGTVRGTFGGYASGDRFRVEIQTGTVKYRKNGVVFYTSGVTPTYPLSVDTSLDTDGATLSEVTLSSFVWANEVGVAVRGDGLTDTAGWGWGLSGASSTMGLQSGDGFVELTATETNSYNVIGLGNGDSSQDYADIDFAVWLYAGYLYVYESGNYRGYFGAYAPGDRLRVGVEGGVVKYRRNGTLLYTSAVTPQYPLLVDTALYPPPATIAEVVLEGTVGPMPVATPGFSPAGGTYTTAQTVAIACATTGATIRYTTDGSEPTTGSTAYTAPLSVGTTTTLKAKAWKAGLATSVTATATYQMNFGTLAAPTISPAAGSYFSSVSVTMAASAGAAIRYTTDGSEPTAGSAVYGGAIVVESTSTVKAKAFHPDYTPSPTAASAYTIVVATPTFTPDGGTHAAGQTITVSTETPGATIRYTLTGLDPTTSDPAIPSGGTLVVGNYTLKATAWKTGCTTSGVKSAVYSATGRLTDGVASGGGGHVHVAPWDGTVWGWGAGSYGVLGDDSAGHSVPGRVKALTGVTALAMGAYSGVARRSDGTVWTWGLNDQGQLGDGTTVSKGSPVQVAIAGVSAVAAGESHVVAVKSDGTVWSWGQNADGQLGDGTTTTPRTTPVQVVGLTGVTQVAAGRSHSLALKADGTVWAWGRNGSGQLGDGTTTARLMPVRVDGLTSITAVAAGVSGSFSLALRGDGTVWAWGENTFGQLGDGSVLQRLTAIRVTPLSGVAAIRAGNLHSLALRADGTVWSWGENGVGQLGDGTTTGRTSPVLVSGLSGIAAIGAGSVHSVGIDTNGSVWAWGSNAYAQIGDGTFILRPSPTRIAEDGFAWKAGTVTLSVGSGTYTANLTVTLSTVTPGATIHYTTNGNEPTEADASVASGGTVSVGQNLVLKAKAWKAGMPPSNTASADYTLKALTPSASPAGGSYAAAQSVTLTCATSGATIRYTTDGTDPTASSSVYGGPILVSATTTLKAKGFKADWTASDTLTATYTLNLGTLAAPTLVPAAGTYVDSVGVSMSGPAGATIRYTTDGADPIPTSTAYTGPVSLTATTTLKAKAFDPSYAASATTTVVYTIKAPAPALSPGTGGYGVGQAVSASAPGGVTVRYTLNGADPTATDAVFPSGGLALVASSAIKARGFRAGCSDSDVVAATYTITGALPEGGVAAGLEHSGAFGGGTVWTWGLNGNGQLGDGTTLPRSVPAPVPTLTSGVNLEGGSYHSLALRSDGSVWAWGSNGYGQLGDGTTTDRLSPVAVSGLASASAVAAGGWHSVGARSDGTAWAWGYNANGQLGDGTTTERHAPVQVSGLSGVVAVAAGGGHSLALKSDGTVWAWGHNGYGQLGDGTNTQREAPVPVSGLTGVAAIAAGAYHSLALKSDGTVWSWGMNWSGQLGDGSGTSRTTPVQVAGLAGARAIAAGGAHSLAATTDGRAWAWGDNGPGQLGDGGAPYGRTTPVAVVGARGFVRLAAGDGHSLALDLDGAVWAWGRNNSGQVGDGTTINRFVPVKLSDASFAWSVATPTMSPAGGSYSVGQTVTLSCATPGTTIHYTTNGADPTEADPGVASGGTVAVGMTLSLKARAYKAGMPPSNVAAETYALVVATPTASVGSGTYTTPQTVTLSTTTAGATIRYTTDGTAPTETSPAYTAPIVVDHALTLRAGAWMPGWTPSGQIWLGYTMKVATPTLSPGGGPYGAPQTVTVTSLTPGAVLHYATTGLEPTESDPVVASGGTVTIDASATLRVKGWKSGGWTPSDTAVASYVITLGTAATPSFSPAPGSYSQAQVVTISSTTPGATIRYTTDGSTPTLTSTLYQAPIPVDWTTTLRARAFKRDWTPSATATGAYTISLSNTVAPAEFSPPPGAYATTQTVTLTTGTAGALLHYTTNGSEPTQGDPSVASGGTVNVDRALSLKVRAFKAVMTASSVRRADYAITGVVSAAFEHGFALKVDGTLWGWGVNGNGQVGNGTANTVTSPVQVLSGVRGVSAVGDVYRGHTLAVKTDGTVWGWGDNSNGMLGNGSTNPSLIPVQASGLTGVVAVAAGAFHSLALTSGGTVYAWGYNYQGQLGDGTQTQRLTPVPVPGLSDVVAVAAGYYHSLALKRDGTVYAWGDNSWGQLGDGTQNGRTSAAPVASLSGVTAIAAGTHHSLALRTDGAASGDVWAWGINWGGSGTLGDGTTLTAFLPVRVLSSARAIGAAAYQSLYLRRDAHGQGVIWGAGNHNGDKLTSGAPASSTSPRRIGSGDFVALDAGDNFSLAILRDTRVVSWGTSAYAGAGNGLVLGTDTGGDDPDQDGLTTSMEWDLGTDPWNADTNGDGLEDGAAVASGKSATDPDVDGDGLLNAAEASLGTNPWSADSDGDGVGDGTDAFPLDPTRSQPLQPTPGDTTPPVITLQEPTNTTLLSVVPPL